MKEITKLIVNKYRIKKLGYDFIKQVNIDEKNVVRIEFTKKINGKLHVPTINDYLTKNYEKKNLLFNTSIICVTHKFCLYFFIFQNYFYFFHMIINQIYQYHLPFLFFHLNYSDFS